MKKVTSFWSMEMRFHINRLKEHQEDHYQVMATTSHINKGQGQVLHTRKAHVDLKVDRVAIKVVTQIRFRKRQLKVQL